MFSPAAYLLTLLSFLSFLLPISTLAAPTAPASPTVSQCNTGPVQCCQQLQSSGDPGMSTLLGLLDIVLDAVNVPVGLVCSPLDIGGLAQGANCQANPVCCEDNSNSLVSVGCVPINLVG
ncbi:fungal hydrophobin [Neolentinus lepideus HHB14362 ss-1]|uniref:Hydrophobin n=1 Tax=Neolentinus lepideus HHB14362 ss-1 TaxID=1314782 RepID=A0A165SB02_9AGAM|nr:fungal hydrophobin [Neolentinus lepideus HHB14362 ss-1]